MNNKHTRYYAVLALLLLTASALSIGISNVSAADYQKTYSFVAASPNPAGVNQEVALSFFLSNLQASAGGTGGARFHGLTLSITKPDGTKQSLGPFTTDAVSTAFTTFHPDQTGNYTIVMSYPGEFTPATVGPGGSSPDTTFSSSVSNTLILTVQQNAIPTIYGNPTPTNYWTRPINDQNVLWSSISNNWLMPGWDSMNRQFDQGPAYVPYGSAPNSPHVLWTKPLTFGGLMGGETSNAQFTDGRSYEQFFKPPVVISGRLYYNLIGPEEPFVYGSSPVNVGSIVCVDLKDGTTIFTIPNASLSFGQIYNYVSPNQAGGLAYLWEARTVAGVQTWRMFDAWTGQWILNITNVPSGTILLDSNFYGSQNAGPGDILVYNLNAATGQLTVWNSSKTIPTLANFPNGTSIGTNAWQWRPVNVVGASLNAIGNSTVFLLNQNAWATFNTDGRQLVTTLADLPGGTGANAPVIRQVGYDNTVYVSNGSSVAGVIFSFPYASTWVGYNMVTGAKTSGPVTIDVTSKIPQNTTVYFTNALASPRQISADGTAAFWCKETQQFFAWNVKTGQYLWATQPLTSNGFHLYNWEAKLLTPDNYLYNWGYDGMVHAFNGTTGASLWDFSTGNAGTNSPYGVWPVYNGITIMDGKLFAQTSDHGNGVEPLYQGEALYALDYKTGQQLWNITGWWEQPVIADGKYVTHNCYDNQIYAFGKGPSGITLNAPNVAVTKGTPVILSGSVSDVSPGAKQLVSDGKFNIVPLVSDADQGTFMNYLYQQQQMPANVKGVNLHLTAFDPNGNTVEIGTATSDSSGFYHISWVPDITGSFVVTAAFEGSNSYYPSAAKAAVGITPTPSASVGPSTTPTITPIGSPTPIISATPTNAPTPNAPMPVALYVAIAAAVVIIMVVAAAVVLRKRK